MAEGLDLVRLASLAAPQFSLAVPQEMEHPGFVVPASQGHCPAQVLHRPDGFHWNLNRAVVTHGNRLSEVH